MTNKVSTFAIMACLASSLGFAGDKAKSVSPDDATATTAANSDNATRKDDSPLWLGEGHQQGQAQS